MVQGCFFWPLQHAQLFYRKIYLGHTHQELQKFPFSHSDTYESCHRRIKHSRTLDLTSNRQSSALRFGLWINVTQYCTNFCFNDIDTFGLHDSMHHFTAMIFSHFSEL